MNYLSLPNLFKETEKSDLNERKKDGIKSKLCGQQFGTFTFWWF